MSTLVDSDASIVDDVNVVLLFTDIEDSTPKWESSAAFMAQALQRHDDILSRAIATSGGSLLKHTGDGVIARFGDVPSALAAAIESQRRLRDEDFSSVDGLTVRMGIHAGRAQERDGDLYGPTLNQCGRVMSAAHGGQVITTLTVATLLRDQHTSWCDAEGIDLVDLGVHRFKGLSNPERLFQVSHPDVPGDFPSPRSLNALFGNLPGALPNLFGRDELIEDVVRLVREPQVVTLTGPAGVGKTSVALAAARGVVDTFPDGVWVIDLQLVTDEAGVAVAIAQTMGIAPRLGQSMDETLRDALGVRRALLILDNAQRPREGVARCLKKVLVHGSPARVLATSFSTIGLGGEVRVRVQPLSAPEGVDLRSLEGLRQWPALELFVERARVASPTFELSDENKEWVVTICEHLDGLPLAIELAAARVELLTPEQIARRLTKRFQLLQSPTGSNDRHQALSTTLEWSVELLSAATKDLFVRLGVLASTFDLEAACAVSRGDEYDVMSQLAELVSNSLLVVEQRGHGAEYRMLESLRLFAEDQLEGQDFAGEVSDRHAAFFAEGAATMRASMWGSDGLESVSWGHRSFADLRRAFEHYLAADPDAALKMTTDLYALWILRDLAVEGVRWFDDVVAVLGGLADARPTPGLVVALDDAGTLAWMIGEQAQADLYLRSTLVTAQRLGLEEPPKALVRLGMIRWLAGDVQEGQRMCRTAVALAQRGDAETQMVVERTLGAVVSLCGDREEGAQICRQAVERARSSDLWLASALTNFAWASYVQDPSAAAAAAEEAVAESTRIGSAYYLGSAWSALGLASAQVGDVAASCRSWAEAIENMLTAGAKSNVLVSMGQMSDVMMDAAPEAAISLAAASARQPGPGTDGTWLELRYNLVKERATAALGAERFEAAWRRGVELSIDSLVRLARAAVDENFH